MDLTELPVSAETVFTSRLAGRRLLDTDGLSIGRVRDVVILTPVAGDPPRALGLVVALSRRHIFVSLGRVTEMSADGVTLGGSTVDLGKFSQRPAVEKLPASSRRQLADALHDEELADVLQEMPEADQISFLAGLGVERIADIIEEMEPDDATDLLEAMPAGERERLLAAIRPARAADLRRLLSYGAATGGGLMTSDPLVVTPDAVVAEVLARIRQPGNQVSQAAQVYVCEPPSSTPTGRYLGSRAGGSSSGQSLVSRAAQRRASALATMRTRSGAGPRLSHDSSAPGASWPARLW